MFPNNSGFHSRQNTKNNKTTGCGKFMMAFYVLLLVGYVLYSTGKIDLLFQKISAFARSTFEQSLKASEEKNAEMLVTKKPITRASQIYIDSRIFDTKFLERYERPLDNDYINEQLEKASANKIDIDSNPLHLMAINNRPYAIVKLGIELPELLNAKDSKGICPLAIALLSKSTRAVEALLMFPEIDLTVADNDKYTILHCAAKADHLKAAERAIQNGISPNAMTTQGVTPLFIAIQNDSPDVARLLVAYGADPKVKIQGKSCMDWARSNPRLLAILTR